MLVDSNEIELLIPQRPPIVMVAALLEHSETASISMFVVSPENIFVENELLQMPGIVENIAQTCALRSGYDFKQKLTAAPGTSIKPPVGFIGEVKNLEIVRLPKIGETLQTRVEILHTVFTASVIKGSVYINGEYIAGCEMKIFVAG